VTANRWSANLLRALKGSGVFLLLLCAPGLQAQTTTAPKSNPTVLRYTYELVEKVPQPRENFVQGLQLYGDSLYVGTGRYGQSRLIEYAFPAMTARREVSLAPELFGEGITRLDDSIYQLTWRAGKLLVYDADSLTIRGSYPIATEGWGITHDGSQLYYSDGSATLRTLDPQSLEVTQKVTVTLQGRPLPGLNELEWIDGEIWANVWRANQLVRIDPTSGQVRGIVDLRGLLPAAERTPDTDVLNGIAWDEEKRALWVTGKNWPWLYHVRPIALPGGL